MRWGMTNEERRRYYEQKSKAKMDAEAKERRYFAWRPVILQDGRTAWLETVMMNYRHIRRGDLSGKYWRFRQYWPITPLPKPDRVAGDP